MPDGVRYSLISLLYLKALVKHEISNLQQATLNNQKLTKDTLLPLFFCINKELVYLSSRFSNENYFNTMKSSLPGVSNKANEAVAKLLLWKTCFLKGGNLPKTHK